MSASATPDRNEAPLVWRLATLDDLSAIMTIQDQVHTLLPEREAVFADKLHAFAQGCGVLVDDRGRAVGYGISHPWLLDDVPPLDTELPALPRQADCLFVHDVALLPLARGRGAGRAFVVQASGIAAGRGYRALALVSVYGTAPLWGSCGFAPRTSAALEDKLAAYGAGAVYMTTLPMGATPVRAAR